MGHFQKKSMNSGIDKLVMDMFSQFEPVFGSKVSTFFLHKYVANIRTIIFIFLRHKVVPTMRHKRRARKFFYNASHKSQFSLALPFEAIAIDEPGSIAPRLVYFS